MNSFHDVAGEIHHFNRFYAEVAERLDDHLASVKLSLTEMRVLKELSAIEKCTAGQLAAATRTDGGYLTRVTRAMEKQGLISRQQSRMDARSFFLQITAEGRQQLAIAEQATGAGIRRLLEPLPEPKQQQLAASMKAVRQLLSPETAALPEVHFRYQLQPGDAGFLIHLHGSLYAAETGYNLAFETDTCKTVHEFLSSYSPAKDRIILAVAEGRIVGTVAVLASSRHLAQLKWLLVHPDFRGQGLGKRLLSEAISFCKEKNYQHIYLMTTSLQARAIALYKQAGFRRSGEKYMQLWGQQLYEQRYDMDLSGA
ncbi:bifunctional helix-turn-helix transcriptional regulator/GNAT family N-acetyltransferase [Chitinophaga vietnamensis]|uniref:bifunctional helix-turn-helix transcriptional regulator/GNAT family N-acetyltransferase n=1 Tax=Chitinophaga vietnamensis TaxID=2593957 RepID=UPI00117805B5|nr:helix-turn-helix domain-containing GNAT family N-acetyltransferase [Chitinophaga vietnamensis]